MTVQPQRILLPGTKKRVPGWPLISLTAALIFTCGAPPRIDIVTPRRGDVLTPGDVRIVWRPPSGALRTGDHYHVFLDRDLPAVGEPIPFGDPRVVHVMGDTSLVFHDVEPGPHRVTVVLGDASHRVRGGLFRASVPFRVAEENRTTRPSP